MADANQEGPGGPGNDLDLKNFYRDNPDADQPPNPRTTQSVDIKDFYRSEDAAQKYAAQEAAQAPTSLYSQTPQWNPAAAADAAIAAAAAAAAAGEAAPEAGLELAAGDEAPQLESAETIIPADYVAMGEQPEEFYPVEPPKLSSNPIVRFAAIGALGGIVFGAVMVLTTWVIGKPTGPYDLGNASSTASGLKGHLFIKWEDNKLQYRLTFQPSEPAQHAAFALAVSNPPRPLSIAVQLKDAMGFALCTHQILLRYDPNGVGAQAADTPAAKPGTATAVQASDPAQLDAAEKQREQGKDIFQTQNGADGRIESLNAQGTLPCPSNAYEKVVAWSFTPDFPSLAEQNDLIKQQAEKQASVERAIAARKKAAQKPADKTLTFSIEGDNSIVGYDAGAGVLETNSAMAFYVEKDVQNLAAWQNFPVHFHYHCDQTSFCTLTRAGGGQTLHAKLRK